MTKVILVTGGSRGIGAACCRLAAAHGYDVAVNYAGNAAAAAEVAADVRAAGQRAVELRGDIADDATIGSLFDQTEAELGPVTAFVSNAGVINVAAPLADIPVEEIRRIIDIDLTAHVICNREAVRRMALSRGGKGGAIVNISSKASTLFGAGGFIPYGAAKGGVDVLTQGLGREVAADGVRINALRPGLIDTEIHDDSGQIGRVAKLGPSVPIGRAGTAMEVAEAVIWLLSDHARYVTGTLFDVSGGR